MPRELDLSIAVSRKARTRPLRDGSVSPDGVDPVVVSMPSRERHRRMLKHTEFDVCELSAGSFLASHGKDYPFTAIPAIAHRQFRHGNYLVNADAGIEDPVDLEGKRIGLRRWQNTAALWMRGILDDYYGVDLSTVEWYVLDEDEVPVDIPAEFDVRRLSDADSLAVLLDEGELDAVLYPRQFDRPNVELLFPDYPSDELEYYRETGLFPIMHVVVIRDDLVAEHPWLATNVRQAFERANQRVIDELERLVEERDSLRWARTILAESDGGYDPVATERGLWTDGLSENAEALETMIDYGRRYGLVDGDPDLEDLFVPSSTESLPEHT